MVLCSFFMLNLFVGVITDTFNRLKKLNNGESPLLTPEQRIWLRLQKMMMEQAPKDRASMPAGGLRRFCYQVTYKKGPAASVFFWSIHACIVANCIVLATQVSRLYGARAYMRGCMRLRFNVRSPACARRAHVSECG